MKMEGDFDKPTELTGEDVDKFFVKLMNGDYDVKKRPCFGCGKDFYPNYDYCECDECYFAKWPKEMKEEFFRSFFE